MLVPSCQCRGSSAGTGVGSSSTSAQPGDAMAVGCGMTLKWQLLVQPFLATATLYLEEASEVVSGDGCSLSVRWGALWCSHPGSHSVPSRLGPGRRQQAVCTYQWAEADPAAALQAALLAKGTILVLQAQEEALGCLITLCCRGTETWPR